MTNALFTVKKCKRNTGRRIKIVHVLLELQKAFETSNAMGTEEERTTRDLGESSDEFV